MCVCVCVKHGRVNLFLTFALVLRMLNLTFVHAYMAKLFCKMRMQRLKRQMLPKLTNANVINTNVNTCTPNVDKRYQV